MKLRTTCERCGAPAAHADTYNGRFRAWCEEHTPWSGHYEDCPEPCERLMAKARAAEMAAVAQWWPE